MSEETRRPTCGAALKPPQCGCLADELRHGNWARRHRHSRDPLSCESFEYTNHTCGPPLSAESLCAALDCRDLFLVGDSTVRSLAAALPASPGASNYKHKGSSHRCQNNPDVIKNICVGVHAICPRGVSMSFVRNNFLIEGDGINAQWLKHEGPGLHCPWRHFLAPNRKIRPGKDYPVRSANADGIVVIMGTGAHNNAFRDVFGKDRRYDDSWHQQRATAFAGTLQSTFPAQGRDQLVWIKQHVGLLNFTRSPGLPLDDVYQPAGGSRERNFSWNLLPHMYDVAAEAVKSTLGDRVLVIDTMRALMRRPDCRNDLLHLNESVLLHSLWIQIQNGVALINQKRHNLSR